MKSFISAIKEILVFKISTCISLLFTFLTIIGIYYFNVFHFRNLNDLFVKLCIFFAIFIIYYLIVYFLSYLKNNYKNNIYNEKRQEEIKNSYIKEIKKLMDFDYEIEEIIYKLLNNNNTPIELSTYSDAVRDLEIKNIIVSIKIKPKNINTFHLANGSYFKINPDVYELLKNNIKM